MSITKVKNTFTPDRPASSVERCYGRSDEIARLVRASQQNSVAVVGPYGIGKSTLLGTAIPDIESSSNVISLQLNPEIDSCDLLAKQLIHQITTGLTDTVGYTIQLGLPKVASVQLTSQKVYSLYNDGLHLQALLHLIDQIEYIPDVPTVFCLDQCELAPKPLALFMRGLQGLGLKGRDNNIVVAVGNPPFIEEMRKTEPRIADFLVGQIDLTVLDLADARDLVRDSLLNWCEKVHKECNRTMTLEESLPNRIAILSGGHPHLLQLIGHQVIENEVNSTDWMIDGQNLNEFLTSICSSGGRYARLIDRLEIEGAMAPLRSLLTLATGDIPTKIKRTDAIDQIGEENLAKLCSMGHAYLDREDVRIIDELFRFRLLLDSTPVHGLQAIEEQLISAELSTGQLRIG